MRLYTLSHIMNQNALLWLWGSMNYVHVWLRRIPLFFSNKHAPPGGLCACGPLQQWGCALQWWGSSPEVSSAGRPPAHTVSFKSKHSVLIHAGEPFHYFFFSPARKGTVLCLFFWLSRGMATEISLVLCAWRMCIRIFNRLKLTSLAQPLGWNFNVNTETEVNFLPFPKHLYWTYFSNFGVRKNWLQVFSIGPVADQKKAKELSPMQQQRESPVPR